MSLEAEPASLFITIKIIINLVYSITLIIKDIFENLAGDKGHVPNYL